MGSAPPEVPVKVNRQEEEIIMQTNHCSEDVSLFYGIKVENNDITKGTAYKAFTEQVGSFIKKGLLSKDEANTVYRCMLLTYGDNELTFDKELFAVKCKNAEQQATAPRPFWSVVNTRKDFNDFVSGLYGDWSADINVRYLSSIGQLSVVLVTKSEYVITETLEFNYELKFFTIIRNDNF